MRDHLHGSILAISSGLTGAGAWFLGHIEAINGLMQFGVLAVSAVGAILGLRKVLRK